MHRLTQLNFDKTEVLFLRNPVFPHLGQTISKVENKKAVKFLVVFFTYDRRLGWKQNIEETIDSIKTKLRLWKWRNLTIIGRIQIVKAFIIPMIMYRAGSICIDKEVTLVSRIIFDFIWKGKDKVKRLSLISNIEDGRLRALHLESIIKTQRIIHCKKIADGEPRNWKFFLLHYLKPFEGRFLLGCNYCVNKLPINLLRTARSVWKALYCVLLVRKEMKRSSRMNKYLTL